MLFPESERVLYKNNPLVEVICQFRYPTILRIREGQLSDFQERIRDDYSVYSEQQPSIGIQSQVPKELAAIIEQVNFPIPRGLVTHRFSTKDSKRFISLRDESMALAETKYERWESFKEEIVKAETALKKVYNPAFYSRIGLRYRDIISRSDLKLTNVKWKNLLKPHILAVLDDQDVSEAIQKIQTRAIIKILEIPDAQITLTHGLTIRNNEECYLIDADFSVERKEGINGTYEILERFHWLAGWLFRWAIMEELHNAMEPRAIRS